MKQAQKRLLFILVFWLAFIFVTSCFVIPFDTFVHFVQDLSSNDHFKQWFAGFWLVSWFVVVKGWHVTEYAVLVVIVSDTLRTFFRRAPLRSVGSALLFAALFAASDEWHQSFVPGRDGCVRDVFIDLIGATLAALFLLWRVRRPA